jgi:hypothetical protein
MIYISGRITGNKNWKEQFQQAEDYLLKLGFSKYQIKNPLNMAKEAEEVWKNPTYVQYMIHDIHELIFCTDIYMLRGWWRSKGAKLERHIAKVLGLGIVYQKRGDK